MSKQNEIAEVSKRIEERTKLQELMKAANKVIKSKKLNNEQKVAELTDSLEFTRDQAINLLQPDYAGRVGFASYKLSNNNQEINRLKKRLAELEKRYSQSKEGSKTWEFDGGTFETDYDDDRIKIYFDDIPDSEMRSKLKGSGWRWSRKNTAWQRQITDNAIRSAKQITGATEPEESNKQPVFTDYKGTQIMYEPHNKEYFVVNDEWERNNQFGYKTKDEAKQWIDEIISRDEFLSDDKEFRENKNRAKQEFDEQAAEMFKFKADDKVRSKEDGEIYIVKSVLPDGRLLIVHPDKTYMEYIEERENYEPVKQTSDEKLKTERNVGAGAHENWDAWDKFQSDVTDLLEDDVPRSDAQGLIEANNSTFKGFYDQGLTPAQAIVEFWSNDENEPIEPSKDVVDFFKTHSKEETYLYNNRNKGLQTKSQYNANHKWISEQTEQTDMYVDKKGFTKTIEKGETEIVERDNGFYISKNYIPYDKKYSTIVFMVSDDDGNEYGQFVGYAPAMEKFRELVKGKQETEKRAELSRNKSKGFWNGQVTDIEGVAPTLQIANKYPTPESADQEIERLKPSLYSKTYFSGSKDVVPNGRDLNGNPLPKGWYLINKETKDILTNGEENKNRYDKRVERGDIQTTVLKVKTIAPESAPEPSSFNNQFELNEAIKKWLDDRGITAENANKRTYTESEKKFLKAYTGYGGLGTQDKESSADVLRIMEFYTPLKIIQTMWGLAYKNGFKETGSVLETSAGTGEFLQYAQRASRVMAIEVSRYSSAICKILYPSVEVLNQPFEKTFIDKNYTIKDKTDNLPKFDLCIGNPPYASFDRLEKSASRYLLGMGEKDYTKAKNYVEYFLRRSVDMLKPEGLLIQIVGAELMNGGQLFLDSDNSPVKTWLAQNCELVEAYRLPAGVFETTNVTSEILVIRKKSTI